MKKGKLSKKFNVLLCITLAFSLNAYEWALKMKNVSNVKGRKRKRSMYYHNCSVLTAYFHTTNRRIGWRFISVSFGKGSGPWSATSTHSDNGSCTGRHLGTATSSSKVLYQKLLWTSRRPQSTGLQPRVS